MITNISRIRALHFLLRYMLGNMILYEMKYEFITKEYREYR